MIEVIGTLMAMMVFGIVTIIIFKFLLAPIMDKFPITWLVLLILSFILMVLFDINKNRTKKRNEKFEAETASKLIRQTNDKLKQLGIEIDIMMKKISDELEMRKTATDILESKNKELASREEELKKKVELLKDIPIDVATYFEEINRQSLQKLQKSSFRLNILTFILGVIFTLIITWVFTGLK